MLRSHGYTRALVFGLWMFTTALSDAGAPITTQAQAHVAVAEGTLLRKLPLVTRADVPETFSTAGELLLTLRRLPETQPLAHMEALRRGYAGLNDAEREHFATLIRAQYQSAPDETLWIFLHGYTQVLFKQNPPSLRLLKIADERWHSAESALAYGLALADIDTVEGHEPNTFSDKKMRACWALLDAASRRVSGDAAVKDILTRALDKLGLVAAYQPHLAHLREKAIEERRPASVTPLNGAIRPVSTKN